MKKIVIFDLNRTLYDPDTACLVPGARFVLRVLLRRGFSLCLVSRAGRSRKKLIRELGIRKYFLRIVVSKEKGAKDFVRMVPRPAVRRACFVVGDRVRKEIRIGNALGFRTVWVQSGKFAAERPRLKMERPTYRVRTLRDVLSVVH